MKKLFVCVIVIFAQSVFAGDAPNFPFLSVQGTAEMKVQPDKAKISFHVIAFNKDAKEAANLVYEQGKIVLSLAKSFGVHSDQVTSFAYSKNTKRKESEGSSAQELDILGYEVTQKFTVEINQIAQFSLFADQLLALSNVENIQVDFDTANRKDIDSQLIKQAAKDAQKKAQDLAEGMGVKIGSVFAITQDRSYSSFDAVFGVPSYNGSSLSANFVPPPSLDFVPDAANMFIPRTIEFNKVVNVVFKIK